MVMGMTATASRIFLYGLNDVEVIGMQPFLDVLDRRQNVMERHKGLLTGAITVFGGLFVLLIQRLPSVVCNHIGVYAFSPTYWTQNSHLHNVAGSMIR